LIFDAERLHAEPLLSRWLFERGSIGFARTVLIGSAHKIVRI
jgi:hypothetical protein